MTVRHELERAAAAKFGDDHDATPRLFRPLFDRNDPYTARGWVCQHRPTPDRTGVAPLCNRVVRTRRGMVLHLLFAHNIKLQGELWPCSK